VEMVNLDSENYKIFRGLYWKNARKLTYAHLYFQNFSGGYTPGPPLTRGGGRGGEGEGEGTNPLPQFLDPPLGDL
jgi:hypothetical protein